MDPAGEISFCAYNTGLGWRQIIENMHKTATLADWHKTRGRHEIYTQGRSVELNTTSHDLFIPQTGNSADPETGNPQTGRPEKGPLASVRSGE